MSALDAFRLDGKVAIVTGAGRGIGASIARTFAEAGANIVLTARTKEQLDEVAADVRAAGREALVIPADVNDNDVLEEIVARTASELGRIDIVVNNAGGTMPRPFLDTSPGFFERSFHFNVTTAFVLSKAATPHLLASGEGSIVNISSAIGRLRDRGFVAYGTAKAALSHMTRLTAADLAPKVRVNAIAVGSIATSALEIVLDNPEVHDEMVRRTPLKRLGRPQDIALCALYLASPAGSFVTGKLFEVDGGLEEANLEMGLPDLTYVKMLQTVCNKTHRWTSKMLQTVWWVSRRGGRGRRREG
ncbi:MAG: 7-alpha-hydroxysteroid dehydrogenase [Actinomycetota bacterium]|nr:7-alpha-hydroxysteroid dehydrogenase [Actinomycetota bacterium]